VPKKKREMEAGAFALSYLRDRIRVHWTPSIKKAEKVADAKKEQLLVFLRKNITEEDSRQLGISSMKVMDIRRHCFSMVFPKDELPLKCQRLLCSYASMTRSELLQVAMEVCNAEEDNGTFDPYLDESKVSRLKKDGLVSFLIQAHLSGQLPGINGVAKLEECRRGVTEACLNALRDSLAPTAFLQEAKNFLCWARFDACSFESAEELRDRIAWLKLFEEKFTKTEMADVVLKPIIVYIERHILPFVEYRPDLLPSQFVTFQNMGISKKLRSLGVATDTSDIFNERRGEHEWFFQQRDFLTTDYLDTLRVPQTEALKALEERLQQQQSGKSGGSKADKGVSPLSMQYEALSHLRIWFEEFLKMSYCGTAVEDDETFMQDGISYRKALVDVSVGQKSEPLLIVLPTGVGKSLVMCLAPFFYKARRVLVIAPNVGIRNQLSESFERNFENEAFGEFRPIIAMRSNAILDADRYADVYVCNYQMLQSDKLLLSFPREFFDLILVDEAHHAESFTYRAIRDYFWWSSVLFLTATPHRSDGQILGAKEIYTCFMANAINKGYIKDICYAPVALRQATLIGKDGKKTKRLTGEQFEASGGTFRRVAQNSVDCMHLVIQAAVNKLQELRTQNGVRHQIIVQAENQEDAFRIRDVWRAFVGGNVDSADKALVVEVVSSRQSVEKNAGILERLSDDIDVIIHVAMLGEGFDHPHLSICVMFQRFGSFSPFAQFVGRVLRRIPNASEEDNRAFIIAHPALGLSSHWEMYANEKFAPDDDKLKPKPASTVWDNIVHVEMSSISSEKWFPK
jgi:superfamily II DNA or RNA helicase